MATMHVALLTMGTGEKEHSLIAMYEFRVVCVSSNGDLYM